MRGSSKRGEAAEPDINLGDMADSLSFSVKRTDAIVFRHFNRCVPRERLVRDEVAMMGIGVGEARRWTWGKGLLRASGAVVAVGGVFFMWKALT